MKVIREQDFIYLGKKGTWHVFESRPKPNYDPERLYEKRARFLKLDGSSKYFDPIQEENCRA